MSGTAGGSGRVHPPRRGRQGHPQTGADLRERVAAGPEDERHLVQGRPAAACGLGEGVQLAVGVRLVVHLAGQETDQSMHVGVRHGVDPSVRTCIVARGRVIYLQVSPRSILYALLGIVAAAGAVLSFAALRDLALVCGFSRPLAWLLPVVVDAGAAAGSLAWLGRTCGPAALVFGRRLALVLLGSSVAGNAVVHALAARGGTPHWGLVVVVSAVAPSVLGAVVHLAVLVGRAAGREHPAGEVVGERAEAASVSPPQERRPGPGAPPGPTRAPDGPPPQAPERTAAQLANAEAARRSRERRKAHSRGDHSTCFPRTCPDAPQVRAA